MTAGLKRKPGTGGLTHHWQPLRDSSGQRAEDVQFRTGQRLFSQRDVSDAHYILISGELAVRARPRDSDLEQVIAASVRVSWWARLDGFQVLGAVQVSMRSQPAVTVHEYGTDGTESFFRHD